MTPMKRNKPQKKNKQMLKNNSILLVCLYLLMLSLFHLIAHLHFHFAFCFCFKEYTRQWQQNWEREWRKKKLKTKMKRRRKKNAIRKNIFIFFSPIEKKKKLFINSFYSFIRCVRSKYAVPPIEHRCQIEAKQKIKK